MDTKLQLQVDRFIKSGLKESRFTNGIYHLLYIETNQFIAHFDKSGFYERRFNNDADITASQLRDVRKPELRAICIQLAEAIEALMFVEVTEQRRVTVVKGA